jgi:hypothetical protein
VVVEIAAEKLFRFEVCFKELKVNQCMSQWLLVVTILPSMDNPGMLEGLRG